MTHASASMTQARTGEFPFTDTDFEVIARTLYDETGIHLPKTKATLVYSRIAKRLRSLGLESFKDYCALVGGPAGQAEKVEMLAALTTNVTRFLREPHHFEHLKKTLLPLLNRVSRGGRLRIWSAGCSSGQEPYSIALTLLSLMPEARAHDIRILATDINSQVLATGRHGVYPSSEFSDVPVELRNAWSEPLPGNSNQTRVDDAVRGLVTFKELNLMGHWPMRGPFDAVFCRNVVIYFDEATQAKVWSKMLPLIAPGGVLYIGHSERLVGPAAAHFKLEGTTTYRKTGAAP